MPPFPAPALELILLGFASQQISFMLSPSVRYRDNKGGSRAALSEPSPEAPSLFAFAVLSEGKRNATKRRYA
jgi:hypothetical protein